MSQIPEDDGKPKFQRKSENASRKGKQKSIDLDDEDDDDFFGEEDDEKVRCIRSIVFFEDFGLSMSLFGIETIETDMQFVEKPKARWQYGITINKCMEPSIRFPRTNISVWFEREEVRDERFSKVMEILEENGFNVIKM